MSSSPQRDVQRLADYWDRNAEDFDAIYESHKSLARRLRDGLRGTVLRRLDFVVATTRRLRPDSVLDVGCGSGRFALPLAQTGAFVVGIDLSREMLAMARGRADAKRVGDRCVFVREDFLRWQSPRAFDFSIAMGVFDYVAEPGPFLAKMVACTSGTVVASFPKKLHPLAPLRFARLRMRGCPVYYYTRRSIEALVRPHTDRYQITPLARDYMLAATVPAAAGFRGHAATEGRRVT